MTPALTIEALSVAYGNIVAVRGVSLHVGEREMVALIGPNGAGKTTLLAAASGLRQPCGGSVRLFGQDITGQPGHRIARAGLLLVPEGRRVLGPMTVMENLSLGREALGSRPRSLEDLDRVFALFPVLAERRAQSAGSLSGGQQQMLAIGRALMGAPRMLLLDEPSLGLSPLIAGQVFAALATLNRAGLPILVVEQNAARALAATERAYVIEGGRIAQHGTSASLGKDRDVAAHYLGIDPQRPKEPVV